MATFCPCLYSSASTFMSVCTEIHADSHTNPSHSLWNRKAPVLQSLANWTFLPQLGCSVTVTSLFLQLWIQALWDSKSELQTHALPCVCMHQVLELNSYNSWASGTSLKKKKKSTGISFFLYTSVRRVYAPRFFVSSQQRFGVTDIKAPSAGHSSWVLDRPCHSS